MSKPVVTHVSVAAYRDLRDGLVEAQLTIRQLRTDAAVAEALCRRALTHLKNCSDTWTPGDPLVIELRKFLREP